MQRGFPESQRQKELHSFPYTCIYACKCMQKPCMHACMHSTQIHIHIYGGDEPLLNVQQNVNIQQKKMQSDATEYAARLFSPRRKQP